MITIINCTARNEPQFEWMADSVSWAMQFCPVPVELICIDKLLWRDGRRRDLLDVSARRDKLRSAIKDRFPFRHAPPKPTPWQGPWRKTKKDYFALCNARNTGLVMARGDYVVFLDDCSVVDEDWLVTHAKARMGRFALAGTFKSWNKAVVVDGKVVVDESEPWPTEDPRDEMINAPGSWLWGLNMGFPLEAVLAVDGYDETFDGQAGSEEVECGARMQRNGTRIIMSKESIIHQILGTHDPIDGWDSQGAHNTAPAKQKERTLSTGRVAYANELLVEQLGMDPPRIFPQKPNHLRQLRDGFWGGGYKVFPVASDVETDWRDGQLLKDM